jgi:hypothetical protein
MFAETIRAVDSEKAGPRLNPPAVPLSPSGRSCFGSLSCSPIRTRWMRTDQGPLGPSIKSTRCRHSLTYRWGIRQTIPPRKPLTKTFSFLFRRKEHSNIFCHFLDTHKPLTLT